jgi:hypothetical protein
MPGNIPFDLQEMPFDFDFDQWVDPGLPSPSTPGSDAWMKLVDWNAGTPDALGSFDAGPIR